MTSSNGQHPPEPAPLVPISVPMIARVIDGILADPARIAAVLLRIAIDQPADAARRIDNLVDSLLEQAA